MSLLNEKNALLRLLTCHTKKEELADIFELMEKTQRNPKDAKESKTYREKAEFLLNRNKHNVLMHERIFEYCMCSIMKAPPESEELALAYNQRSKFLIHLGKYQDCINDINRALDSTNSNHLKVELYCRAAECMTAMNAGARKEILEQAKECLEQIDPNDKDRPGTVDLCKRTMAMLKDPDRHYMKPEPETKRTAVSFDTSSVKMEYSRKYGRHLVASRDLYPGDIVIAEPVYAAARNLRWEAYKVCWHCLNMSWSFVPCDDCDVVVFCSETCQMDALTKYHNIECAVLKALKAVEDHSDENVFLAFKMVIMAMTQAGRIENLVKIAKDVDDCEDEIMKGWEGGQFSSDTFKSFYTLDNTCIYVKYEYLVLATAINLIALARFSDAFQPAPRIKTTADIIMNDNMIFIGALMLKMSMITTVNSKRYVDPITTLYVEERLNDSNLIHMMRRIDSVRGLIISAYGSLLNHSCNPNVYSVCTEDGNIIYYCSLTIPKGSQIFDCYGLPFYSTLPKADRRKRLYETYQIRCHCDACTNEWGSAPWENNMFEYMQIEPEKFFHLEVVGPMMERFGTYTKAMSSQNLEWITVISKVVKKNIEQLLGHFQFPNTGTIAMLYMLRIAYERMYGSLYKDIPYRCIEHFKMQQNEEQEFQETKISNNEEIKKVEKNINDSNGEGKENKDVVKRAKKKNRKKKSMKALRGHSDDKVIKLNSVENNLV